jgi:hypothetical protein
VEKARDIVDLVLNPLDKAMVHCVDEKTPIQSFDRTQPLLPMGLGFLRQIEKPAPEDLDVHLILDMHYTPTCASWHNQVVRWSGTITQRAIRRGCPVSTT